MYGGRVPKGELCNKVCMYVFMYVCIAWPVLFVAKQRTQQFNMASFPIIQVTEGEQRSLRLWDVLGVKIPEYFTKHPALLADYISNFETRPDDVFVVSYPKSGSCIFIVILSKSDNWIMFVLVGDPTSTSWVSEVTYTQTSQILYVSTG